MWRYFYDDNNVDIQQWLTWEGITSLAEQYYEWSGGRAMVALESVQDYIFTYSAQQLPAIVPVSYTHLDVYKRQAWASSVPDSQFIPGRRAPSAGGRSGLSCPSEQVAI